MAFLKKKAPENSGAGSPAGILFLVLFLFTGAVVLVLNLKWLYYLDIVLLDIENESGMNVAAIRENYDALIRYNRVWFRDALVFPSLPMSESGRIHFAEVKRIFDVIQILFLVSGIGSAFTIVRSRLTGNTRTFRTAGVLSLVIPVILGLFAVVGWDRFFVAFHHLFFRNDYWLFDWRTDPVILMLPDTFFFHCAVGILLVILSGGIWLLRRGRK